MEQLKQDYSNICAMIGQLTYQKANIDAEIKKLTEGLTALAAKMQTIQTIKAEVEAAKKTEATNESTAN